MTIEIVPLTAYLGAEIRGLDLRDPLDPITRDAVYRALLDHLVIFFRDQHLTPDEQVAFGRQFGELHIHPFVPSLDEAHPEIIPLGSRHATEGRAVNSHWHADATFEDEPPMGSILQALEVPDVGRDTLWVSTYAAYDTLSPALQSFLDGLHAVHDSASAFGERGYEGFSADRSAASQRKAVHPVVRTHPDTGHKALYVNEQFTAHLEECTPTESRALLGYLYQHLSQPSFQVRWHWTPGAIAFWDNRSTQHCVAHDGDLRSPRLMHRVTLLGDRPS